MKKTINLFIYAKSLDKLGFNGLMAAKYFIGRALMQSEKHEAYSVKIRAELKADPRMPLSNYSNDFNTYSSYWCNEYRKVEEKLGAEFLYFRLREIYIEIEKRLEGKSLPTTANSTFAYCRKCGGLAVGDHSGNFACECGNYGEREGYAIPNSIGEAMLQEWNKKSSFSKKLSKKPKNTRHYLETCPACGAIANEESRCECGNYLHSDDVEETNECFDALLSNLSYSERLELAFDCAKHICALGQSREGITDKEAGICENWVDFMECNREIAVMQNEYTAQDDKTTSNVLAFYLIIFRKIRKEFKKDFGTEFELISNKPVAYIEPACTCTCEACIKARESHVS